jgi:hypothetical protein
MQVIGRQHKEMFLLLLLLLLLLMMMMMMIMMLMMMMLLLFLYSLKCTIFFPKHANFKKFQTSAAI